MKKSRIALISFILGLLVAGTTAYAAYKYQATEVGYTPSNSNFDVDNVESAINELYEEITATGPTYVAPQTGDTHKGIVYLDPTNLRKGCNVSNSTSTTGTKKGCMKWYVFKSDNNTYTMILDHNTTACIAWRESDVTTTAYDSSLVKPEIEKLVGETKWVLEPRLITGYEIAGITGYSSWAPDNPGLYYFDSNNNTRTITTKGASKYAWLFDYTNGCEDYGCNINDDSTYGYWTSTPSATTGWGGNHMYGIGRLGTLAIQYGHGSGGGPWIVGGGGIRPVITINKSIIK